MRSGHPACPYFAHLYRIGRHDRRAAVERAIEMANLADRRDTRADKLSGGMRRRLLIARALAHRPRLVLLNEPTGGLDPQVRQELWALIDAIRAEGTTILMSTHYAEEAQRLADTVLIMSQGSAVARDAQRALRPARRPRGGRGVRAAGAARRGRGIGAGRRLPHPPDGDERLRARRVRSAAFGSDGWVDAVRLDAIVAFGLAMRRVAIHAMTRKLVD